MAGCHLKCSEHAPSEDSRCPAGYSMPSTGEACAAAAKTAGHATTARVQEQCERDPCPADVEHSPGDPMCSVLPQVRAPQGGGISLM